MDISTYQGNTGNDHRILASGEGVVLAAGKDSRLRYGAAVLYKDVFKPADRKSCQRGGTVCTHEVSFCQNRRQGEGWKIEVLSHSDTAGVCNAAYDTIPDAIIAAQSTQVDAASGATVSSKAIMAAVEDALSKVGK